MAMLLSCFSRFSSAPRRALRTSAWLATLAVLVFAGQAWGQTMNTEVAGDNVSIPTDAAEAFMDVQDRLESALTTFPNANDESLDQEGNGFLNPRSAEVVDWVLVQARVVAEGDDPTAENEETGDVYCAYRACVTRAGLLMADGYVHGVDENGALVFEDLEVNGERVKEGVFIFEDLEYDPDSQDLYIAIYHRNHQAVMSSQEAASGVAQDVYVYDFTDPRNVLGDVGEEDEAGQFTGPGDRPKGAGVSANTGRPKLPDGKVAMSGGEVFSDGTANINDFNTVVNNLAPGLSGRSYSIADANMNGAVEIQDFNLVVDRVNSRNQAAFTFFID